MVAIRSSPVIIPENSAGSAESRNPVCKMTIENNPSSVPVMVPEPPKIDVPPRTTAAMAASSYPVPASAFACPSREV